MKISKANLVLKKAVTMCKSNNGMLGGRLHILASLRCKIAMVSAITHRIQELMVVADWEKPRMDCHKAFVRKTPTIHGDEIVDICYPSALFDQEDDIDGCTDWKVHPLFSDDQTDDRCYTDEYEDDGDEPSMIDVVRSSREVEGLEINMDYDIDEAAEMFIRKFREQMNESF